MHAAQESPDVVQKAVKTNADPTAAVPSPATTPSSQLLIERL